MSNTQGAEPERWADGAVSESLQFSQEPSPKKAPAIAPGNHMMQNNTSAAETGSRRGRKDRQLERRGFTPDCSTKPSQALAPVPNSISNGGSAFNRTRAADMVQPGVGPAPNCSRRNHIPVARARGRGVARPADDEQEITPRTPKRRAKDRMRDARQTASCTLLNDSVSPKVLGKLWRGSADAQGLEQAEALRRTPLWQQRRRGRARSAFHASLLDSKSLASTDVSVHAGSRRL